MSATIDALVLGITRQLEAQQPTVAAEARAIRERLEGPLRVAIAGRVKAGKSTLLNALVGERLAPTDAGECTRIVTWYRKGPGYAVSAHLRDGTDRQRMPHNTGPAVVGSSDRNVEPPTCSRPAAGVPRTAHGRTALVSRPHPRHRSVPRGRADDRARW
mgnify:CR=1 FL=1